MAGKQAFQGTAEGARLLGHAARMNLAAAVRTRRRGYAGWTGAINTDYDPQDPLTAAQPFDAYRALHGGGRVHYNPRRATFIISRLDDVRAALRDTDQVTSSQGVTRLRMSAPLAVLTDGEEHARLRRQVQPGFSKGAMNAWQGMIEQLAEELVGDVLANPGCDVVRRLAIPMPIRLIAQILGIPNDDVGDFRRWSERGVGVMDVTPTLPGLIGAARSVTAMAALQRYFVKQFTAGELKGSNTVLGRLLAHNTDGSLTDRQLLLIAIHLLIAGNETTTNLLGGMFDTLAHHPDQYEMIRAQPDLVPLAVEEQLRTTTPIQNLYRYTRADYQVGDVTIPNGSRVLLSFGAANRDPTAFEEPDQYRADRNPRTHVAFGYGAHMCLGAPLARMEAQAVLRQLITRVSRITPAGPTTWSTHSSLRGPTRLPVRLTAA
ncbi:cytochrome P450 [Mycobacterium asiaticum]|uniref:cytochrome P450 n=1 Tax=Mycobacterium asiaticum TaxID=1790 RepID=UPI000687AD82|nr:cytochrome P450 [Mycobacterium asiaticum]ORA18618.1 cytochrome P450 [Mycobacterium asiaticum DSM 44297]